MYALGALSVWLIVLGFPTAILAMLVLWLWWLWQGVQRRRPRPPRQPYDDGYQRRIEDGARERGARDAERDLRELEA